MNQNPLDLKLYEEEFVLQNDVLIKKLERISMSECKLQSLPTFLERFNYLKSIDCSNNLIREVPKDFLIGKQRLCELVLSKNQLEQFSLESKRNWTGKNTHRLAKLDLSQNRIERIDFSCKDFKTTASLSSSSLISRGDSFNLDGTSTPTDSPRKLESTEEGGEEGNGISSMEREVEIGNGFEKMEREEGTPSWKIEAIAKKKEVPLEWNYNSQKEENLNSKLEKIELYPEVPALDDAFRGLKVLNVGGNRIDSLVPFLPLFLYGSLEIFLASINRIKSVPAEFSLDTMRSLVWIDLSNNHITLDGFPEGSFSKIPNLKHLYLQGNDFETVPTNLSSLKVNQLQILDLPKCVPSEIVEGKIYLGSMLSAQSRFVLKKLGVTHVVSVVRTCTPYYPDDFKYHLVEADDVSHFDITKTFEDAHKFMDEALEGGGVILVHW